MTCTASRGAVPPARLFPGRPGFLKLEDLSEAEKLMRSFAQMPPLLDGVQLTEKRDYHAGKSWLLTTGTEEKLTLPRSKVLYYRLADDSWFCIRPSGRSRK